jgi:hypothetical protein
MLCWIKRKKYRAEKTSKENFVEASKLEPKEKLSKVIQDIIKALLKLKL